MGSIFKSVFSNFGSKDLHIFRLFLYTIFYRYYIKNTVCADQLLESQAAINELAKESDVHLLHLNALELATQLMVNDFTVFRQIGIYHYLIIVSNIKLEIPSNIVYL